MRALFTSAFEKIAVLSAMMLWVRLQSSPCCVSDEGLPERRMNWLSYAYRAIIDTLLVNW